MFDKMTDSELDKLAAETFGLDDDFITSDPNHENYSYPEVWEPCDPDSNQAERHLFPKLKEIGLRITVTYGDDKGSPNFVSIFYGDGSIPLMKLGFGGKLNRTKVIACLEAWEKLK